MPPLMLDNGSVDVIFQFIELKDINITLPLVDGWPMVGQVVD
jgi:hypothetical protein